MTFSTGFMIGFLGWPLIVALAEELWARWDHRVRRPQKYTSSLELPDWSKPWIPFVDSDE